MAQKPLQALFSKPMDRREFLAHVGAGALAIIGVGGVLRMLTEYTGTTTVIHQHNHLSGYGSSPYGGVQATSIKAKQ